MIKTITISSLVFLLPSALYAQNRPVAKDWTLTLGAASIYSPVFMGAEDYGLSIFPDVRVNYRDKFFASVPDGVGVNIINENGWRAGPVVKIRFGREEDDGGSPFQVTGNTNALRGLGDVDTAGEIGGFLEYTHNRLLRARAELRQGFGGHDSPVFDASLSYVGRTGPASYSIGPRATFAGKDFMNTYFGINPAQSAASGLASYRANGGVASAGIGASATMPVSESVAVSLFGGYDILGREAADSPLIRQRGSRHQATIGLGVGYRFGWNVR